MTSAAEATMRTRAPDRIEKTTFPLPGRESPDFAAFRALKLAKRLDFETLADLLRYGLLAWSVPQRNWPELARSIACNRYGRSATAEQARIERILGDRLPQDETRGIQLRRLAAQTEEYFQFLRDYRPGGFAPEILLQGREHIDAALRAGNGAVLWWEGCTFSLILKIALHRARYRIHQLSHPTHRLSRTRLGMRFLNPVLVRVENRYLAGRVWLSLADSTAALNTLRQRLRENAVIGVTVTNYARRVVELPFLDGRVQIATGAVKLSLTMGAPLLPVFLHRDPGGRFRVVVDAPLLAGGVPSSGAGQGPVIAETVKAYVARLEPYVLAQPHLWNGWSRDAAPRDGETGNAFRKVDGHRPHD